MTIFAARWVGVFAIIFFSGGAWGATLPCIDKSQGNKPLPVMNDTVLDWKNSKPNQWHGRALVSGKMVRVVQVRASHIHLEIQIGATPQENLEVVYSRSFGELPKTIAPGTQIEACGDFIVARAKAGGYPPSPMGAIIHWVHYNPGTRDGGKHEHGFVGIEGVNYGQTGGDEPRHILEKFLAPALEPAFGF